jgi:hypothetical protein
MTYAEFLASQGATAEDIAILNTPIAQKAFAAQDAAAQKAIADYKAKADEWYESVAQPNLTKAEADATKARQDAIRVQAEAARLRSLVAASTDESLKQVAKDMGFKLDGTADAPPPPNLAPGAPGFDPNKYFTRDDILQIAEREGDAIAIASDIAFEHRQLFPDKPLNFRELRKSAVAAKKPVEQYWMETFGVQAARDARAKSDKEAYDARLIKQGHDAAVTELASQYANPNTVPAGTSSSPFVPRPKAGREKPPWEAGVDAENGSNDRVTRAAKSWADRQTGTRTN